MTLPLRVEVVEVGPRDGLQNEAAPVPVETRVELIERLADAGLPVIEAGAFVSERRVPQMAASGEVLRRIHRRTGVRYPALVPNLQGLEAARAAGALDIAIFVAASEGFSQANLGCSRAESLDRLAPVAEAAMRYGMRLRGYVSCVIACPYDGPTATGAVVEMAVPLLDMGCSEVSLGDTIGVGYPEQVRRLIGALAGPAARGQLAMHFHDTQGRALDNIRASLEEGIAVFDSSVAGLGGCPFAPGATGNVATEAVVGLLEELGIETGVDRAALAETGRWIRRMLGRGPSR